MDYFPSNFHVIHSFFLTQIDIPIFRLYQCATAHIFIFLPVVDLALSQNHRISPYT